MKALQKFKEFLDRHWLYDFLFIAGVYAGLSIGSAYWRHGNLENLNGILFNIFFFSVIFTIVNRYSRMHGSGDDADSDNSYYFALGTKPELDAFLISKGFRFSKKVKHKSFYKRDGFHYNDLFQKTYIKELPQIVVLVSHKSILKEVPSNIDGVKYNAI